MKWTGGKIVLVVAGIAGLGAAGYYGNHYITCQGLEDDFLNSVGSIKSTAVMSAILPKGEARDALASIRAQQTPRTEAALHALYEQCGIRAGETAVRKGSELLLP